ncbi:hypothetical protein Zmor_005367 [Zophobas morio]|uniref:Uncharacterized protein n=1 Tax=Zophobas morio TaxID=2755281 RepID=A0AA38IV55_9CUCU|nr:hypothetical protein Zmor_005367 [Zophobas morio]
MDRFNATGSVLKEKSTGRPTVDGNVVNKVKSPVEKNPHSSLRRLVAKKGTLIITVNTARRSLTKSLEAEVAMDNLENPRSGVLEPLRGTYSV